ncbi:NACHT domain-containing protein [Streptomyces sp. NPDC002206]
MTYFYEQLDPERFQHFCQALIAREYPGTQCFPVGQRDGGRDAVQFFTNPKGNYRLFQVKFVRNPHAIDDVHKWLVETMKGEIPKIRELLRENPDAVEYILISNVAGTAYPNSGSIDTLNDALNTDVTVPIRVWWRDDLDRRCDGSSGVKWSYPDILRGVDILQALSESIGPDLQGSRLDVLRSFAVDQFEMDNEVRFKQVELSNEILNLFVDVPARISSTQAEGRRKEDRRAQEIRFLAQRLSSSDQWETQQHTDVGAATLFLSDEIANLADIVVLEGGPGQGKSTLAQYVCQVHRMKILSKPEFETLPTTHRPSSARFPIKVDLREYATWLSGKNPFAQEAGELRPANLSKSLESFMSALIRERSGGLTFGPDDLAIVARSSALLIVLDGLDEVAEVKLRNDVVREITASARRLQESAASLQIIVTTRPSALAEVSDFPTKTFHKWTLTRLGRPLIEEYSERWAKSRRLPSKEVAELRRVLADKLDQPHMRDLARNPMQLAILLSVIHTRGSSLPDKRTALYDIYVELFLAREAEKSEVVKKRQEILIDVHRYLAWVLHSEAETGMALGKIEASRLRQLIKSYLLSEGRDPELAEELFTGLAQRVVFLVGAVEGLFEFEVQPLREYFAGRFLYETAPYSPVGSPRSGTKDERFDAVARNTHWLNVTRFYAGCFSKGELPSLVDRLEVLCTDVDLGLTSHPRSLAATLVADWVFSQNARSVKKVIDLILSKDGYRSLLGDDRYSASGGEPLTLPDGCGRTELLTRCMEVLHGAPPKDIQLSVAQLAQKNGTRKEIREHYVTGFATLASEVQKSSWILSGQYLGVLSSFSNKELDSLFKEFDVPLNEDVLTALLASGHADYFAQSENLRKTFSDRILDGYVTGIRLPRRINNSMDLLCTAVNPMPLFRHHFDSGLPLSEVFSRNLGVKWPTEPPQPSGNQHIDITVSGFLDLLTNKAKDALASNGELQRYVELLASTVGLRWSVWVLALGYTLSTPRGKRSEVSEVDLFDDSVNVFHRLKYARLQAGGLSWWRRQLSSAEGYERQFWALAALTICGPATLTKLCGEIDDVVEILDNRDAKRLQASIENVSGWIGGSRAVRLDSLPEVMSPRLAAILSYSATTPDHHVLVDKYLSDYMGSDPIVHEMIFFSAMDKMRSGEADWSKCVELVRRAYRAKVEGHVTQYFRHVQGLPLPVTVAQKVASNPLSYPYFLVNMAEMSVKRDLAQKAVPLSKVAEEYGWFNDE